MDALETLHDRWHALGFDETEQRDPSETIRTLPPTRVADVAVIDAGAEGPVDRTLPRISIDLPSTQSGGAEYAHGSRPMNPELEVRSVLGEGGMGRVFLAWQRSLDREVAIKTLREHASPADHDALLSEGAVTGYLEHPAIIPVHALGVHDDGRPVLVMKRVDGVVWQELLRDTAHPAWKEWGGDARDRIDGHLEILMQVCNAAHFAHSRGIVHRDIKPQNVLIGHFGDVYLADWGIAHRMENASNGRVCGTPSYMAPEMALGEAIDARTDVYLLGAVLHEILTGRPRHVGATLAAVMSDAVLSPPFEYASSVPADLATLANRATARDLAQRPASAAEFRRALSDHLRHKSSVALSATALPRLDELRALLQRRVDVDREEDAQRTSDALIAEIRFALTQALEQWNDNPDARRALGELEALLGARQARAAELERLARDHDPRVSAGQRFAALAGGGVAAIAMCIVAIVEGIRTQPTPRALFFRGLGPMAVVLVTTIALRRHLFASALNRQTAWGLLVVTAFIAMNRFLGAQIGLESSTILVFDTFLASALGAFAALTSFRWVGLVSLLLLGAACAIAALPSYAHFIFSIATSAALLIGIAFSVRGARHRERTEASPVAPPDRRDTSSP